MNLQNILEKNTNGQITGGIRSQLLQAFQADKDNLSQNRQNSIPSFFNRNKGYYNLA
jgi:hypothetical protein